LGGKAILYLRFFLDLFSRISLGLQNDIDIDQFKFFADLAARSIKENDSVIVVTHEPSWVTDVDAKKSVEDLSEKNLTELMNVNLAGKVRLRLSGDLHHYTRHTPIRTSKLREDPIVSSNRRTFMCDPNDSNYLKKLPELIVSGGGGAFLHGTHTYARNIKVGEKQDKYVRVSAYPSALTSFRIGWLNMWQFRWRNWRLDIIWAITYFCTASSLFPLCGVYDDFKTSNHSNPYQFLKWVLTKILMMLRQAFISGRVSPVFILTYIFVMYIITDSNRGWRRRLVWGCTHGMFHVLAALSCALFVECLIEWSIHDGVVRVSTHGLKESSDFRGMSDIIYHEYNEHFAHLFQEPISRFSVDVPNITSNSSSFNLPFMQSVISNIYYGFFWVFDFPLLRLTFNLFDLPGLIATRHSDICQVLCEETSQCMLRSDKTNFLSLDRVMVSSYLLSIFLYFVVLAIPVAGSIFGTWLALMNCLLKAQCDMAFSALRCPHWKNFLRLHIKKNGDLEVFAVGLDRVPKRWIRDPRWDGRRAACGARARQARAKSESFVAAPGDIPSWAWGRPSKWIPERPSAKEAPRVIDYVCIPKQSVAALEELKAGDGNIGTVGVRRERAIGRQRNNSF